MPNKHLKRHSLLEIVKIAVTVIGLSACHCTVENEKNLIPEGIRIVVLGTIQDGGSPHIGCNKDCCKNLFTNPDQQRKVVCLGLIDYQNKKTWLIEATPDISAQLKMLKQFSNFKEAETPDGIFISHAHIGHYTGLMYLGKEALGAQNSPVFAMPRLKTYFETNGPWSQLVAQNNISLVGLKSDSSIALSKTLSIKPILVPHRDEYSETVGFIINGPTKSALFIPDINKWAIWGKSITDEISKVDYAFLDATFYDGIEINSRNISEIPHPFVVESLKLFAPLSLKERNKIHFIHFNHTNPLLNPLSKANKQVEKMGTHSSKIGEIFEL